MPPTSVLTKTRMRTGRLPDIPSPNTPKALALRLDGVLKANSVVGVMDVMGVIKVALAAVVTRLRANLMGGRLDGRQVMMTTTVLALKVWITLRRSEARRKMVGIACDEAIVKGRKRKKW